MEFSHKFSSSYWVPARDASFGNDGFPGFDLFDMTPFDWWQECGVFGFDVRGMSQRSRSSRRRTAYGTGNSHFRGERSNSTSPFVVRPM